jgi:hypothetical protein
VLKRVSWKDFHGEASGLFGCLIVSHKSTVGFVSKLFQSYFGRCKRPSSKLSSIEPSVRKLHWSEVEGVELIVFFLNLGKWFLVQGLTLNQRNEIKIKTYEMLSHVFFIISFPKFNACRLRGCYRCHDK